MAEAIPGQPLVPETKDGTIARRFRDATEFAEFALAKMPHTMSENRRASSDPGSYFYESDSREEAFDLLLNGWPKGLDSIAPAIDDIARSLVQHIPQPRPVNDMVGGAVDVGAYNQGIPENMVRIDREERAMRSVHVVANVAASAAVSGETIMARGRVIAALTMALDRLGVPVGVSVCSGSRPSYGGGGLYCVFVNIKDEGAPLDLGRVAFATAHPSMLRRCIWSVREQEQQDIRGRFGFHSTGGYGMPTDVPSEMRGDVYLPAANSMQRDWLDPERAVGYVLSELRRLGVLPDA